MSVVDHGLIIDHRAEFSQGCDKILRDKIKWEVISKCCIMTDRDVFGDMEMALKKCGGLVRKFENYSSFSGLVSARTEIISNDVVLEQLLDERTKIWSWSIGGAFLKDMEYRRSLYGCMSQDKILRAISAFSIFPNLSRLEIIRRSAKFARKKDGALGRFWQREAGREAMERIRIPSADAIMPGSFDSLKFFLCFLKK